jgi:hypothetical protein
MITIDNKKYIPITSEDYKNLKEGDKIQVIGKDLETKEDVTVDIVFICKRASDSFSRLYDMFIGEAGRRRLTFLREHIIVPA